MASVNKVILIGNLGKDPEMRYMPSGDAIANFSIATTDTWKDKSTGEKQEKTEWHRIVMFGRQAEIAGEYLKKGSAAYIEGRLQTRKWQNKEGQDQYTTEIVADRMQLLGGRSGGGNSFEGGGDRQSGAPSGGGRDSGRDNGRDSGGRDSGRDSGAGTKPAKKGNDFDDFEDDIPF